MSLPGIQRRLEILQSSMMANSFLSWDVDLDKLVIETHGCSEAELEAIVMNAPYNALYREGNNTISSVKMEDIELALKDIKPFDPLKSMRKYEPIDLPDQREINQMLKHLMEGSWCSLNLLLEGPRGTGKSFLAANIGLTNKFDFIEIISPESFLRLSDLEMCNEIIMRWKEAQSYSSSLIIIDDIEMIVEIGRSSLTISNAFTVCLNMEPLKNHKRMVVATTSDLAFLRSIKLEEQFFLSLHVPKLKSEGVAKVISQMFYIPLEHHTQVATTLAPVAIKDLIYILESATRKQDETSANGSGGSSITNIDTVYRLANLMLK